MLLNKNIQTEKTKPQCWSMMEKWIEIESGERKNEGIQEKTNEEECDKGF